MRVKRLSDIWCFLKVVGCFCVILYLLFYIKKAENGVKQSQRIFQKLSLIRALSTAPSYVLFFFLFF